MASVKKCPKCGAENARFYGIANGSKRQRIYKCSNGHRFVNGKGRGGGGATNGNVGNEKWKALSRPGEDNLQWRKSKAQLRHDLKISPVGWRTERGRTRKKCYHSKTAIPEFQEKVFPRHPAPRKLNAAIHAYIVSGEFLAYRERTREAQAQVNALKKGGTHNLIQAPSTSTDRKQPISNTERISESAYV